MKIGSLFTGYGGLDMAVEAFYGAETVWRSDIDPGSCKLIAHRWPGQPNLGDITAVDWSTVEPVDILTGGFPCQDLSHAGKRAGLRPGTRSGLWTHMAYAISQLRPRFVVAENVRGLLSASAHSSVEQCSWCVGGSGDGEPNLRALGVVLGDLAELGYDTQWVGLRAADVGAPHGRFRVFVVATDAASPRCEGTHGRGVQQGRKLARRNDRESAVSDHPSERGQSGAGRPARALVSSSLLPTPQAHDAKQGGGESKQQRARPGRFPNPALADLPHLNWGPYEQSVRRWEKILGRPSPPPTMLNPRGHEHLSPRFVEWMMGLPAGWITDVPGLSRNEQLKLCGNGVVPQQALAALRLIEQLEVAA